MNTIRVSQGLSAAYTLNLNDAMGNTFTGYTGTESLAGSVRSGTDRMILFPITPSWVDATQGKIGFSVPGTDTLNLPVGSYLLQISLADGSADLVECILEIGYSPGVQDALPTYCTYATLLTHAPWIDLLQNPISDDAGFERERAQARADIDTCILANYRGSTIGVFGTHSMAALNWAGGGGYRRTPRPSYIMAGYLQQGFLMRGTDPTRMDYRPKVSLMAAYRSIAIIGLKQMTINPSHVAAAATFQRMFLEELTTFVAEIDVDQDQLSEYVIPMNSTNSMFT